MESVVSMRARVSSWVWASRSSAVFIRCCSASSLLACLSSSCSFSMLPLFVGSSSVSIVFAFSGAGCVFSVIRGPSPYLVQ